MTSLRESVHRLTRPHLTMTNGAPEEREIWVGDDQPLIELRDDL